MSKLDLRECEEAFRLIMGWTPDLFPMEWAMWQAVWQPRINTRKPRR